MLDYKIRLPHNAKTGASLMVLMHGRGADENDLLALADFFPEALVVAPRAPYSAREWGYGPGFAWYRYLGGNRPDPEHFTRSLSELDETIKKIIGELSVKIGPIFVGGFSQGGTVGMGYGLNHPNEIDTVLNLSGFLADHPLVRVTTETVADTRFYWPHGLHDPAVPFALAESGRAQLMAAGACLVAPDFAMGHQIIRDEIEDIRELLRVSDCL
ncbi:MAG: hypothetical protein J5I90_15980 [Caldilineales bacterium]|nr:hypothetical protein [Caldilineales bacterium]